MILLWCLEERDRSQLGPRILDDVHSSKSDVQLNLETDLVIAHLNLVADGSNTGGGARDKAKSIDLRID